MKNTPIQTGGAVRRGQRTFYRLVAMAWGMAALEGSVGAGSFEIPAWSFDRGNVKTFRAEYADAGPMVAFGGRSPVMVEYDIEFPASGSYQLEIRYAAQEARPVSLLIDGKLTASVCCEPTGSWNTSGAQWATSLGLYIPAGKHTIRLQRSANFPHVVSLKFTSEEIPEDFVLNRPQARKIDDPPPPPLFEPVVPKVDIAAVRRAIQELARDPRYAGAADYVARLDALEEQRLRDPASPEVEAGLAALRYQALVVANPLLDFRRMLVVKRGNQGPDLGLPRNWESNSSLPKQGYDDAICLLSLDGETPSLDPFFKPERDVFVGDLDLGWDGDKLLLSMVGKHNRWQVFELALEDSSGRVRPGELRELTGEQPDVDSYDACYLPDGRIIFTSTACFIGVPCVYGSSHVANLYLMDVDGKGIRQLCFDQEHDWCPTVLNNGRVLYTRWEYADTPHSNTRLLFHMNPDGTGQAEYLGSNSYWPNSFFYARPVPGHETLVVAVVGGHHDNPRMGELVLLDPQRGRQEAAPARQRIPGFGKPVEPVIRDGLTLDSWPKFLHPFPLSEQFFLVSCKPEPDAPWGIYLADIFDNLIPIMQTAEAALFEPVPLRATPRPPIVPDKVNLARQDAVVVIQDVYAGDAMRGVPRGAVKNLRLFTYHFAYQNMGGLLGVVGAEGPWDIRRTLGTVPVQADGSAHFIVPANTPIALQPLDEEGKAIQLMRSWMTAMPGEVVQCAGCHEPQNTAALPATGLAMQLPPEPITPWYGPSRGFSYPREVQPVIDRHCLPCHDGQPRDDGRVLADLRGSVMLTNWTSVTPGNGGDKAGRFSVGYDTLNRFVRRNGIEGDYHVLEPMEFHADTTDLVQMLQKGHYGVELDRESWDRILTWIDLNCPFHGTWGEFIDNPGKQRDRRRELLKLYANVEDDPEALPPETAFRGGLPAGAETARSPRAGSSATPAVKPAATLTASPAPNASSWGFDAAEAQRRQAAAGSQTRRTVELGHGVRIELALIPAGEFVMGDPEGFADEGPPARVRIPAPFWMAVEETRNQVFSAFNPHHDSGLEDKNAYQFGVRGYPANGPDQPVVRVSWEQAMAFCRWLTEKTGERFTLPSEAQWEYACRAGAETPFHFGGRDADFSAHANLSDATMSEFASDPYTVDVPLKNPTRFDDWIPKEERFNDGALLSVAPGRYQANAWGLWDMHGNVAEFTRTAYRLSPNPEPQSATPGPSDRIVVRGGSWRDVPRRATSSFRLGYRPWQKVYNVGFRVVSEGPAN